jgi:UDP-N-acetylmuramyl pentapeptide phosphotransferase/UDP-N-acetylglucosamine-1-phosphate transferase
MNKWTKERGRSTLVKQIFLSGGGMKIDLILLLVTAFPFVLTVLVLRWMLHSNLVKLAIDMPNHRSLHTTPVARTGGVAVMIAILTSWIFFLQSWAMSLVFCSLLLMLLSLADDFWDLSAGWRFVGHIVLAGIYLWFSPPLIPVWAMLLLSVAIVWMTNLFNFMDGSDGLAGGMALFGFGAYATAAWLVGDDQFVLACLAIVASSLAFLFYNFHPARIFMGDVGSIPLGFLAGVMGLLGWQHGNWPLWFPIIVFSPFIVDATVTLFKRLLKGENIWQAHRSHYYQRLVQLGWGHRSTALLEYGLMLLTGVSAIWVIGESGNMQWMFVVFWALLYVLLMLLIDDMWRKLAA